MGSAFSSLIDRFGLQYLRGNSNLDVPGISVGIEGDCNLDNTEPYAISYKPYQKIGSRNYQSLNQYVEQYRPFSSCFITGLK
jgi:hypothetical protein